MNLRAIAALALLSIVGGRTSLAVGAPLAASGTESPRQEAVTTNAVAVADFEMADAKQGAEDWSFGLADVLSVELRQRGAVLFERQQIRVVLGERKLTASGLMQMHGSAAQDIPDLQYLVTGSIRSLTNGQFHVEASLVEARTGRNVASFAREGRYSEDIPGMLATLADQIASRLRSSGVAIAPDHATRADPTRTPEINLLFYKGVAYCLAGQPELGVTWFIDVQKAVPNFLPARLWTMRAFEMLDLSEFAAVARARVREAPNGQEILNRLNESRFLDRKVVSMAVIADPRLDAAGWQFQTALKTALGHHTNLFVADPSNIRSLAAEMDLELTENGVRELEMASVLWSTMDALVLVGADFSKPDSFSVELRDALSGEALFRTLAPRDGSGLSTVARDLSQQVSARHGASLPGSPRQSSHHPELGWPIRSFNNTDRNQFAILLRHIAQSPQDRPALMQLAWFARWLSLGAGNLDGRYHCAISDRVVAATDPKEPDAARWLSVALWHRRYYEKQPPSIAVEAAPLLDRYPESPEAHYARSALALEYINQKKYADAAPILLKLAEELPQLAGRIKIRPDYWANFYFFTGAALQETGDDTRARQFLDQADEVLRHNPDLTINQYALGVWVNHFPERHPLFGSERNLRLAVADWRARLDSAASPAQKDALLLLKLDALLTEADQENGESAGLRSMKFLHQLIEHKRENPALYQGRVTEFQPSEPDRSVHYAASHLQAWHRVTLPGKLVIAANAKFNQLAANARTPEELATLRQLAREFATGLDSPLAADCFEAVGEYEQALQLVEKAISNPTPFTRATSPSSDEAEVRQRIETLNLLRQKVRLLQRLGRPMEATAYVHSCMPKLDPIARLEAAQLAANVYAATGHPEQACALFADLARGKLSEAASESDRVAASYLQAEYEALNGNKLEATELLRDVIKQSEGKIWRVRLDVFSYQLYARALERLAQLRATLQTGTNSPVRAWPQRTDLFVPIPVMERGAK